MDVSFLIVDVFAERPFEGNQLCVVPDPPPGLGDHAMQAIAREIGFSETTFVTAVDAAGYSMRIFTPRAELPFAGHPTLGTAYVLAEAARIGERTVQRVAAGEFEVQVDVSRARARMRQHSGKLGLPLEDPTHVAAAIGIPRSDLAPGLPPRPVSTGIQQVIVPIASIGGLHRAHADPLAVRAVVEAAEAEGLYLFAVSGDRRAEARYFAPGIGVPEDAATGSAAGPLGVYMAEHGVGGMPGRLEVRQGAGLGRPSRLDVDVVREEDSWTPYVAGGVFIVGRGRFKVPDSLDR